MEVSAKIGTNVDQLFKMIANGLPCDPIIQSAVIESEIT